MNEVRVTRKGAERVTDGHPWIFSSDIADRDGAQRFPLAGQIKDFADQVGGEDRRSDPAAADAADGQIVVRVIDNGIGIEPDMLPRIFEAFEQASQRITQRFGGLGLGLAISRKVVELHSGRIAVVSAGRDRGCTVKQVRQVSACAQMRRAARVQ